MSIWLAEIGFDKGSIGLFALLSLPLTLKLAWSPLVDYKSLPFFRESPRKGWLLFALAGMSFCCLFIGLVNPLIHPWWLAIALWHLSLFTGCLYIVGIAYELESLDECWYNEASSCVITGYRIGLLCSGGGALYLASLWGWSAMFFVMGSLLALAACIIFTLPEPYHSKNVLLAKKQSLHSHGNLYKGFWSEMVVQPFRLFLLRPDWPLLLILLLTFKTGDHLCKSMAGPFYYSLGFDKTQLALAYKTCGFISCILGSFVAGFYLKKKSSLVSTSIMGCVHTCTLFFYTVLALNGKSMLILYSTVAVEHFTGGMAMTLFISLLWKFCDKRSAAVQYVLLWSLFSLKADLLACAGGLLAGCCSWSVFFLIITFIGTSLSIAVACLMKREVTAKFDHRKRTV